jgi:hypothetical protein
MIKVMVRGNWAPYCGTDYCYALGIYPSLEAAEEDARVLAEETWEPDQDPDIEDEGPEYWVEEYNPDVHDCLMAGGTGDDSFEDEFAKM